MITDITIRLMDMILTLGYSDEGKHIFVSERLPTWQIILDNHSYWTRCDKYRSQFITIPSTCRERANHYNASQRSSSFHLFPLLCGVNVSYEAPPFSSVLHVLHGQFSLRQVVPGAIQPPPLWSSSPSFPRHLHRHHSLD